MMHAIQAVLPRRDSAGDEHLRRRSENARSTGAPFDALRLGFLWLASIAILVLAIFSMRWELHWDSLEWHYCAFLINEKGFTP